MVLGQESPSREAVSLKHQKAFAYGLQLLQDRLSNTQAPQSTTKGSICPESPHPAIHTRGSTKEGAVLPRWQVCCCMPGQLPLKSQGRDGDIIICLYHHAQMTKIPENIYLLEQDKKKPKGKKTNRALDF